MLSSVVDLCLYYTCVVCMCGCCRLDNDMHVKVADFGLSRDIYERDYYSSDNRKCKLPVKWMALESLEKGIYNSKTDVVRVFHSCICYLSVHLSHHSLPVIDFMFTSAHWFSISLIRSFSFGLLVMD